MAEAQEEIGYYDVDEEDDRKRRGNVFDTELVHSTGKFHSNECRFWLSPGIAGTDYVVGVPISVDPGMLKIELCKEVSLSLTVGSKLWINRSAIVGCHILRDDEV